jgi:Bacterial RNA polymerase, alpha chain C terminal domain.
MSDTSQKTVTSTVGYEPTEGDTLKDKRYDSSSSNGTVEIIFADEKTVILEDQNESRQFTPRDQFNESIATRWQPTEEDDNTNDDKKDEQEIAQPQPGNLVQLQYIISSLQTRSDSEKVDLDQSNELLNETITETITKIVDEVTDEEESTEILKEELDKELREQLNERFNKARSSAIKETLNETIEVLENIDTIEIVDLQDVYGIGEKNGSNLKNAGITTSLDILLATEEHLTSIDGVGNKSAEELKKRATEISTV